MGNNMSSDPSPSTLLVKEEPPLPKPEDIHLIACDVDGTLLTSQHVVHPVTRDALKHIRQVRPELPIVISSGKQFHSCEDIRRDLALDTFPASHAHGSVIYGHDEQILYSNTLPKDVVVKLTQELHSQNRATFLFTQTRCLLVNDEKGGPDWLSIAGKYDKNVEDLVASRDTVLREILDGVLDVIKVTVCAEPESVNEYMIQLKTSYPQLGLTRAIPFILELHDPHTNKGTALRYICENLGISPKNCLVFGDGENDVAMFQAAGYSVGMGNGMVRAKEAATHITVTNDEGGVGVFLNRVFRS